MKTFNASIWQEQGLRPVASKKLTLLKAAPMRGIMALAWALLAAATIITLSVWAAGMELNSILGVATWGLGFIFLGLAVDSHGAVARYQAVTGITLTLLALLQNSVSPGFIIVTGVLLATWVAAVLLKLLLRQEVK